MLRRIAFNVIAHRQTSLWIAPVVGAILAAGVAMVALRVDATIDLEDFPIPLFIGTPDTARELVTVIASSVTTLLALIFTIIVVAIQLASSQYSPRTLSTLLQDRPSHFTIGVFVGTFIYTLIILVGLHTIEPDVDRDTISGVSLTLAFVLAVISLGTFAVYSNHIIHSVRITSLINRVGGETREVIKKMYNKPLLKNKETTEKELLDKEPVRVIYANRAGVFDNIDVGKLIEKAVKRDAVIVVVPVVGEFVPKGAPLLHIYHNPIDDLAEYIHLAGERTMRMNVVYGLRQLSDMAVRANSTGINDPATSVQVIDQLHDLLRRLLDKEIDHKRIYDKKGNLRVFIKMPLWKDIVLVALDEVRLYGSSSLQVVRRLRAMLHDLISVSPEERKPGLKQQLHLLNQSVAQSFDGDYMQKLASEPDMKGTGF
jgi:uncharacterized membrane protein